MQLPSHSIRDTPEWLVGLLCNLIRTVYWKPRTLAHSLQVQAAMGQRSRGPSRRSPAIGAVVWLRATWAHDARKGQGETGEHLHAICVVAHMACRCFACTHA
jgi:hypothetical protein